MELYCFLLIFFALVLETMETDEVYKLMRPYKYYQPRPPKWPRSHAAHKSSRFHHFKRIPTEDYYSRRPTYYRYSSNDFDGRVENQPCTIVIELPKEESRYGSNYRQRKRQYERDSVPKYISEEDYIDEEEEESKVVNVNNKKVQIKTIKGNNPRLHIQISKSDNQKNIEFVDKPTNLPILPTIYTNRTMPEQLRNRISLT
ncbi:uncharacterized protein LOC100881674 [Megachile rotundata]|uniref:uncharacterized protein LOC100881674 n=1 Tax=Megachile rotundata TaxID=143995 RepID=UPI003FCFE717